MMKKFIRIYSLAFAIGSSSLCAISCSDKENQEDIQKNKGNIAIRSVR
ncbi:MULTISPECIES: hypothetical protein [Sphingobacterium]|nr:MULTISPECIES: hypothetical protein [Sphingobacterium]